MNWQKGCYHLPQYKYTGSNQRGDHYKRTGSKNLSVANLSCKTDDASGLTRLVLLSHTLDVPVRYNFEDHTAYIEVVSCEALRKDKQ